MQRSAPNGLARLLERVCAGLLGVLVLNAGFELVAWTLWERSFGALEELQGIVVVWLALLAAAYCLAEGLHLAVEVVVRSLPPSARRVVGRLPGAACAVFGLLLTGFGAQLVGAVENTLPGTGWSASLQYQPAVVAGLLIAWIGWRQAIAAPRGPSGSASSEVR